MGNRNTPAAKPEWQEVDLTALENRLRELEKRDDKSRSNVERRLKELEQNADANADGVVTRAEMETYMATQLKQREDELLKMRAELQRVQKEYDTLSAEHDAVLLKVRENRLDEIPITSVNPKAIDAFVEELVNDPNVNIYGIPDSFERAMYRKLFKMALGGLDKAFRTMAIGFMGHNIRMHIQPTSTVTKKDN